MLLTLLSGSGGSIVIPASGVATVSAVGAVVRNTTLTAAQGSATTSASGAVVRATAAITISGLSTSSGAGASFASSSVITTTGTSTVSATLRTTAAAIAQVVVGTSIVSGNLRSTAAAQPSSQGGSSVSAIVDRVRATTAVTALGQGFTGVTGAVGRPSIWSGGNVVVIPDTSTVLSKPEAAQILVRRPVEPVIVKSRVTNDIESTSSRTTRVVVVQDGVKRVKASSDS